MDVGEGRRGIIPRGRKFVVNMRLPGGKKTWITVDNFNSAKRIVEIIDFYVAGFNALPADHPDVPGLLEEFRSVQEFKRFVLQEFQSETNYLQPGAGVIQSTAAEVPEESVRRLDRDRGTTEEPPMLTDAPESSSVCFACGGRGAILVQDPRNPPRLTQAGVDPGHITEFVGRLIMFKKRKHEEEMAELGRLWRMCRAQEQRCATQGTGDGVHVAEGEPKSQLALMMLKEEPHWKHFELAWTSFYLYHGQRGQLQMPSKSSSDIGHKVYIMGVTPTYGSTEHDTTIQASIPREVHKPSDARGETPLSADERMADDFILDSPVA